MPAGIIVKQGNFGFLLTFTIVNANGTPRDLSPFVGIGCAVTLYVYDQEQNPSLLFSGPATVSATPASGVCTYMVLSTDLSQLGTFDAELEMTNAITCLDTETFSFNIIRRHP